MSPEEFRALGHHLVDRIAGFLDALPRRPVSRDKTPEQTRQELGPGGLPERGAEPRVPPGLKGLRAADSFAVDAHKWLYAPLEAGCALVREFSRLLSETPGIEAVTQSLSIATFRYRPRDLDPAAEGAEAYLDDLNAALLTEIQKGGEVFLSNALVGGRFLLRACITNFRTTRADIAALPEIVTRVGRGVDAKLRGTKA